MTLPGFTECPECRGRGEVRCALATEREWLEGLREHACPSCSGVGVVPDPETVEVCADAIGALPFDTLELRDWGGESVADPSSTVARAALLAYAQHAKETVAEAPEVWWCQAHECGGNEDWCQAPERHWESCRMVRKMLVDPPKDTQ